MQIKALDMKNLENMIWCGCGESNPALKLGKLACYRYTTPASDKRLIKRIKNIRKSTLHLCLLSSKPELIR